MNERDELGGRMNELARASARDDSLYATKVVCIPRTSSSPLFHRLNSIATCAATNTA